MNAYYPVSLDLRGRLCVIVGEGRVAAGKVRDMLAKGERPPAEFSRPEVADVLIKWATSS